MRMPLLWRGVATIGIVLTWLVCEGLAADHVTRLQSEAVAQGRADWGLWGYDPSKYSSWTNHSNRLIPIYTFGMRLDAVSGANSAYRNAGRLQQLYGRLPENTLNPRAEYFDQTDVYRLQLQARQLGKKYIILVVFDGMDWHTTWAAAVYRSKRVGYTEGRGTGLHFQDYRGTITDFGYFCTTPHSEAGRVDLDAQTVLAPGRLLGGYDPQRGGPTPWAFGTDPQYIVARGSQPRHAYTDSASSATSMTAGIKTYNVAINMDARGRPVEPIARALQKEGMSVGVVTSVPISHATPAAAYANNVTRNDYQDLTRDLIGLRSVVNRTPLPGVDVLLGAGWGEEIAANRIDDARQAQGSNVVVGNRYLAATDLNQIDVASGGKYRVVERIPGFNGNELLTAAARQAARRKERLFGFFGHWQTGISSHLPYRTADGQYDPTTDINGRSESYSRADVDENPTLAEMTRAALTVLMTNTNGFWLMVEAGDVDWANHSNNIDSAIGAVLSGDEALRAITDWAEENDLWDDTVVIVTADHGHYFVLRRPEVLIGR
jgi:alkaline phosphatase